MCWSFSHIWFVKLEEGSRIENLQAQRCRARLDHLESADAENLPDWNHTRLKRILVDYMLRMSYYDTAAKLAESNNIQVFCLLVLNKWDFLWYILGEFFLHYLLKAQGLLLNAYLWLFVWLGLKILEKIYISKKKIKFACPGTLVFPSHILLKAYKVRVDAISFS